MTTKHLRLKSREITYYIALITCLYGVIFYMFHYEPVHYGRLILEDQFGEYWTSILLFFAPFIVFKLSSQYGTISHKIIWSLIAFGFFFIAAEEISWGQRIFHFDTPALFENNRQAETTIHNLPGTYDAERLFKYFVIFWSIFSAVGHYYPRRILSLEKRFGIPIIQIKIIPFALSIIFFKFTDFIIYSSEIGELFIGITALLWSLDLQARFTPPNPAPLSSLITRPSLYLVVTACISVIMVEMFPGENNWEWRLRSRAMEYANEYQMTEQALEIFHYLRNRPKAYTAGTQLEFAKLLVVTGNEEKATIILWEVERRLLSHITGDESDIVIHRRLGVVYLMLNKKIDAKGSFETAINLDRDRFVEAENPDDRSVALWSLAKTTVAMGKFEEGTKLARRARHEANSNLLKTRIRRWIEKATTLQ